MAVGDPFEAIVKTSGARSVIALRGELDASTAGLFERAVGDALDGGEPPSELVIDLAELGFIDSSGLNVLVNAANRVRATAGTVVVENASAAARRLFSISGIDRVIDVQ